MTLFHINFKEKKSGKNLINLHRDQAHCMNHCHDITGVLLQIYHDVKKFFICNKICIILPFSSDLSDTEYINSDGDE